VLQLAASLDQGSEHPLAMAIVGEARERQLALSPVEEFASDSGIGVTGTVDGHKLALGNTALMDLHGVNWQDIAEVSEQQRGTGASVMLLAVDGHCAGLLAVADPTKPTSAAALEALRAAGSNVIITTGAGAVPARAACTRVGIPPT